MRENVCSDMVHVEVRYMKKLSKELEEGLERVPNLIEEVLQIYEQHQGEPENKPGVSCPSCLNKSSDYVCNWYENKHVHFICKCGCQVDQ